MQRTINLFREYSVPLISGVLIAVLWANISPEAYQNFIYKDLIFGKNLYFLVNDIFMVFFFAIAGVEIVQSVMPGGDLNPVKKAINPLFGTLGGVLGPVAVYLILNAIIGSPELTKGWGIPTATDIALAWLVARVVFGEAHPAVKFLLLLAIVDDGIGLMIIAIFYPDPLHPTQPAWLLLVVLAMAVAFVLRKMNVKSYWPYIVVAGLLSWFGLHSAHLNPALALVVIVPFLPHPTDNSKAAEHSTLNNFEHQWSGFVDFGLFFFGLANAGVQLSGVGTATWLVFCSLVIGKTVGVFSLAYLGQLLGFPLPDNMGLKELFLTGLIAALGLTVALFVSGAAFVDLQIQGAAKMGALFSAFVAFIAIALGKVLRIEKIESD